MTDGESAPRLTRGMKRVLIAVAAVLVIGIGAAVWLSVAAPGAGGPGAAPGTSSSPGATPSGTPGTPGASATSGPLPQATPTTGSEVLPPSATPNTTLPPIPTAKPLISPPLPASATATGSLVPGFPTAIMGPAPKTVVVSSAIAAQSTSMQVTLVGRSTLSQSAIRAHYAQLWASLGLQQGLTSDGSLSYAGAYESLSLAFGSTGTGNRYTVYGVFRTN